MLNNSEYKEIKVFKNESIILNKKLNALILLPALVYLIQAFYLSVIGINLNFKCTLVIAILLVFLAFLIKEL